jgi:hypothetical protein
MPNVYEAVVCKGCGIPITIRKLDSSGDRNAYSKNPHFNADVPCSNCEEIFSYRQDDIELVEE